MAAGSLKSMTAYAQALMEQNGWLLRLSLRSLNHRFLDVHLRLPEGFESLEPEIRRKIRDRIRRGHVDVSLHFEAIGAAAVGVNREVAASYLKVAKELGEQHHLRMEPDLAAILRLPGVIALPPASIEENLERFAELVSRCLEEALERLDQMRQLEGRHLAEEFARGLKNIQGHAARIEVLAERVRPAYARRLQERLKELLGESPIDPARLAQEAALLAERCDTAEELARLRSHVRQFETLLASSGEAGKKLDFLLQEMQREANTLLSKTPGGDPEGLEITQLGLEVKAEIEKLREQVQNIE